MAIVLLILFWPRPNISGVPTEAELVVAETDFERQYQVERQRFRIQPAWLPLNHYRRQFNVLLPLPFKSSGESSTAQGQARESYSAQTGGATLEVLVSHWEVKGKSTAKDVMNSLDDERVMSVLGCSKVNVNRVTTWNGRPGREFDLIRNGQRNLARMVLLSDHDHVILSCLFDGETPPEAVDRFFKSFSLEGDPVKYGSPAGWPTSSDDIRTQWGIAMHVNLFPREMDRSRWLKTENTSLDVLAQIDVFRDANSGRWFRYQEAVVSPKSPAMLVLPVEPVDSYELQLEVRRISPKPGAFNIGLVVDNQPAMIAIDAFNNGDQTCLHPYTRKGGDPPPVFHKGTLLGPKSSTIVVRVMPQTVQADVNGLRVIDFKGVSSQLGLDQTRWFPPPNSLFVAVEQTQYTISKCELRELP